MISTWRGRVGEFTAPEHRPQEKRETLFQTPTLPAPGRVKTFLTELKEILLGGQLHVMEFEDLVHHSASTSLEWVSQGKEPLQGAQERKTREQPTEDPALCLWRQSL